MIYVTGDVHGDLKEFQSRKIKQLKRGDILLICGDFGFVWDEGEAEEKALKWLSRQKYQILFVEGTHDNLERLGQIPQEDWNGGKIRRVSPNIFQLCRGSIFYLEGKRIFAFGGGESTDMDDRQRLNLWWPEEVPSPEELEQAWANLEECGYQFDFAITHDGCENPYSQIASSQTYESCLQRFFYKVEQKCSFQRWYFGCYHMDRDLSAKHRAVFRRVLPLE